LASCFLGTFKVVTLALESIRILMFAFGGLLLGCAGASAYAAHAIASSKVDIKITRIIVDSCFRPDRLWMRAL
jgi:hypothetical protein